MQYTATASKAPAAARAGHASPASRSVVNRKADTEYKVLWGIDNIVLKQVASGALIRFSFRVVDPDRAKLLNDGKLKPQLVDQDSQAVLQIPVVENIGQLRQTASPEKGRAYWMVFSNKGGYVKPGDRVDIVIGTFRITGLLVQ